LGLSLPITEKFIIMISIPPAGESNIGFKFTDRRILMKDDVELEDLSGEIELKSQIGLGADPTITATHEFSLFLKSDVLGANGQVRG
jgi:hypothetical protein